MRFVTCPNILGRGVKRRSICTSREAHNQLLKAKLTHFRCVFFSEEVHTADVIDSRHAQMNIGDVLMLHLNITGKLRLFIF
jgi:hypothetical protein